LASCRCGRCLARDRAFRPVSDPVRKQRICAKCRESTAGKYSIRIRKFIQRCRPVAFVETHALYLLEGPIVSGAGPGGRIVHKFVAGFIFSHFLVSLEGAGRAAHLPRHLDELQAVVCPALEQGVGDLVPDDVLDQLG